MKYFLLLFVIPLIICIEVIGVAKLYPKCYGNFWLMLLLCIGIYITYDLYMYIKNYCYDYFNY